MRRKTIKPNCIESVEITTRNVVIIMTSGDEIVKRFCNESQAINFYNKIKVNYLKGSVEI